ncbi:MAG: phosphoribosylglycinamide formyltransferase [Desulfobacterales bacterium]|jgi:phosphoribosylglycinamide formyltransferase-1
MAAKIRIGALISGGGSNLQAIIDACKNGDINGQLTFIGSDNPKADGLKRAAKHQIPSFVVDYRAVIRQFKEDPSKISLPADFDLDELISKQSIVHGPADANSVKHFLTARASVEAKLLKAMAPYPFDLLVLAGFMRNLSPYFIDRINLERNNPRIMNIHPALLPAFPGVDGYGDTFRYGCKVGGCTVHFIDYGEDTGPIIGQRAFPITAEDTIDSIRKKGLELEWELYPKCIQMFAEGRLKTVKKTFRLDNGKKIRRTVVEILPEAKL